MSFIVYTDGACKGNPGIGGYAAIILYPDNKIKVIAGGEEYTTNNRMELMGVIKALEYIANTHESKQITLYTDSQYISRAINEGWLSKWLDHSFEKIKNKDLWLRIWKYVCMLNVEFIWVKGHANNQYNELADKFAQEACYFQGKAFDYLGAVPKS
jgi:ribonuclease HI